jgi:hypothetical protein
MMDSFDVAAMGQGQKGAPNGGGLGVSE